MTHTDCRNCQGPMQQGDRFCPACGQSVLDIKRPWTEVSRDLLRELFDLDGRMARSMRTLLGRPGLLTREYMDGRRATYTPPIRMYLVISLGFFLVLPAIIPETSTASPAHEVSVDRYSKAMFLMLPLFALLLKLFYRRVFYLAHLVFAMHLFSAMFIGFAAIMSIEALADRYLAMMVVQAVLLLVLMFYCVTALRTAFRESRLKSIAKFLALLVLFLPIIGGAIELASHVNF